MEIKGKLLLVGGGEYKGEVKEKNADYDKDEITQLSILNLLCTQPSKSKIEIVTTGSNFPKESYEVYKNFFEEANVAEINMMDIAPGGLKSEEARRLGTASAVFITGGSQEKLLGVLKDSKFEEIVKKRYQEDKDFILGGTSAGAMVLSEMTISDSSKKEKLIMGNLDIWPGVNILTGTIVDSHFFQRMRFTRLALGLLNHPSLIGIGLPENTGVLVIKGYLLKPEGSEMALILDASEVGTNNFKKAKNEEALYAEGLKVHFLNGDSIFSLRDRKLYSNTFSLLAT